jgi:hypothetical protein
MARAVLVAIVLMQCCNMIVTAGPLLETPAVAGGATGAGTSWLGLIMQVLGGPGGNNNNCTAPNGSCP